MSNEDAVRAVRCKQCEELHLLEEVPPSEGLHYWCPAAGRFFPEKGGDDEDG